MEEIREPMMKTYLSACLVIALSVSAGADPETKPDAKPAAEPEAASAVRANTTITVNNLKMLHLGLIEFDSDYGAFPDEETGTDVTEATGTILTFKGGTSNAYFRQLLATEIMKSEKIFQLGGGKVPDEQFKSDATALAKGECGIAYILGLNSSRDASTPVAVAPLVPGKLQFDPGPFGGKAVVLRMDGSVNAETITPEGNVMVDGKSLFDPAQPFWKGKAPKVAWPE
jgi:hypothetical protein